MRDTIRKHVFFPMMILALASASAGCGGDPGTKTGDDPDGGSLPEGDPITGYGTTDLDYDSTPLPDPTTGLPPLENVDPQYTPALAGQTLPEAGTEIQGLERVASYLGYGEGELDELAESLRTGGVLRRSSSSGQDLMAETLVGMAEDWDAPGMLVTADAFLNTFHNFFDNLLLGVEVRTLRPELAAMLPAVKAEAAKRYNSLPPGPTRDAALTVVAYLQTAESLLDQEAGMVAEVYDEVSDEWALIQGHEGLGPSPIFDHPGLSQGSCASCDPCQDGCGDFVGETFVPCAERYCEDYTQYVPRGHYTYDAELESYFRAVMWLGRMTFLNRSDHATRAAVVLLDSIKDATAEVGGETRAAADIWRRFFRLVGTFVGSMDDLNLREIDGAVVEALGTDFALDAMDDAAAVAVIQARVDELRDPEILSGFLSGLADAATETKGLRLLGQAFLPDSWGFGEVIFDEVGPDEGRSGYAAAAAACGIPAGTPAGELTELQVNCVCDRAFDDGEWDVCRGLPSGLDVLAFLGSEPGAARAQERFGGYAHYTERLGAVVAEFASFDLARWGISAAWTWLFALEGLLADKGEGAPAFMRTEAWDDKTLETAAASWAEMRHDTILYAKQSYTPGSDGDTDVDTDVDLDYLEPQPEAYSRLAAALGRLRSIFGQEGLYQGANDAIDIEIGELKAALDRATAVSIKELGGVALDGADIDWIRALGYILGQRENLLLEHLGITGADQEPDPDRLKTTVIADVHTWPEKGVVLQVGSGYLDYVGVLHQLPSGEWGVAVGPAFSYHEFEQPMADRLTDEEWRDLLESDPDLGSPDWL